MSLATALWVYLLGSHDLLYMLWSYRRLYGALVIAKAPCWIRATTPGRQLG